MKSLAPCVFILCACLAGWTQVSAQTPVSEAVGNPVERIMQMYARLQLGMSRDQVEAVVGKPILPSVSLPGNEEEFQYAGSPEQTAEWPWGISGLKAVFRNGLLVSKQYSLQWVENGEILQVEEHQTLRADSLGAAEPAAAPMTVGSGPAPDYLPQSYCNPLPLPDYPRGNGSKDRSWEGTQDFLHWVHTPKTDFRETADPSVLFFEGKWYLYSSCGMAYVSDDMASWRHVRIEPYDIGYAPTVVYWRGKFLLTACAAKLWESDKPLGPFHEIGPMLDFDGRPLEDWRDPMLFADDDGALYAYWGLGGKGIKGAPLNPSQPNQLAAPLKYLMSFNPDHEWERYGAFNEHRYRSYCEGAWMFKYAGRYYLTYAAPGTEFRTYGMGAYVSDSPLGPFSYLPDSPFISKTSGLVQGPGHGSIVRGPNDTLWAFYTCTVGNHHIFERRIGMDPIEVTADGRLASRGASEVPQWAPGVMANPARGNDIGWRPLTASKPARASSYAPGRTPNYATDNLLSTWWEPATNDAAPWLMCHLRDSFDVSAVRLHWSESGLEYAEGATPGPVRYVVELSPEGDGDNWLCVVNASENTTDMLIDYRTFPATQACRIRVRILGHPEKINTGLLELTAFGLSPTNAPPDM